MVILISSALMAERVLYNCLERGFYFNRDIVQVDGTIEELVDKLEGIERMPSLRLDPL